MWRAGRCGCRATPSRVLHDSMPLEAAVCTGRALRVPPGGRRPPVRPTPPRDIVHRDLKLENLLLVQRKDISAIKLADFGLAKRFGGAAALSTVCGTPQYVAPEIIKVRRPAATWQLACWSSGSAGRAATDSSCGWWDEASRLTASACVCRAALPPTMAHSAICGRRESSSTSCLEGEPRLLQTAAGRFAASLMWQLDRSARPLFSAAVLQLPDLSYRWPRWPPCAATRRSTTSRSRGCLRRSGVQLADWRRPQRWATAWTLLHGWRARSRWCCSLVLTPGPRAPLPLPLGKKAWCLRL